MPMYEVQIERVRTETIVVEVRADDEDDAGYVAERAAKTKAASEWELESDEFDVVETNELEAAGGDLEDDVDESEDDSDEA